MSERKELRPYQEEALTAIRQTLGQGIKRLVVQAPTGAGKTLIASTIAEGALRLNKRLTFCVSSIGLIDQTVEMFYAEGVREVGVIQQAHMLTDWSKPIQVASIQTLRSRGSYPQSDIVVIDEVHQLHKAHIKWIGRLNPKRLEEDEPAIIEAAPGWEKVPVIGLSATPWTKGLGRYFESLLVMSTTAELIDLGYLARFKTYAADHPDLSDVKIVAGDYHEGQLARVMGRTAIVANVIETWRTRWNKDKTLVFGVDCAHAQTLRDRFLEAGISCAYQDAYTTPSERAEIKRGFHDGTYRVVCNVGTLTVGIDWDVRCLVLARPTRSEMLFVQIVGRALRTAPGKDHALILDDTATTERLGFVTDIHHEMLDDGRFKPKKARDEEDEIETPLPKPCPQCAFLIPARTRICPECGYEKKPQSRVIERRGELVEFTPGDFGRRRAQRDPMLFPYSEGEKRKFFAQLRAYATMKDYKPGWAAYKFKEKFGGFPPWAWNDTPTEPPGAEVLSYIKSSLSQWLVSQGGTPYKKPLTYGRD